MPFGAALSNSSNSYVDDSIVNTTIVVFKDSKLSGFVFRLHAIAWDQVRFKKFTENGGQATCNVYFPRFQVDGLA